MCGGARAARRAVGTLNHMNFFGVGPAELIVILVVALVFVGPERLPRLAADLARTIREVRKYTGSLAAEFNEVIQDFERETESDRGQWKEIGEGLAGATKSVTEAIRGARADAEIRPASSTAGPSDAAATSMNDTQAAPEWREIPEPQTDAAPSANGEAPATGKGDRLAESGSTDLELAAARDGAAGTAQDGEASPGEEIAQDARAAR